MLTIVKRLVILLFFLSIVLWSFPPKQTYAAATCNPQSTVNITRYGEQLSDLVNQYYYRLNSNLNGYTLTTPPKTGGLYPNGNTYPNPSSALAVASQIVPRNLQGVEDPLGKIVFLSIGMSNTSMEFLALSNLVQNDSDKSRSVAFVNGAMSGQDATRWLDNGYNNWSRVLGILSSKELSAKQVQVAWVKEAIKTTGDFPGSAEELSGYLEIIARNLKSYFPNIKIAYYSSRTRSYLVYDALKPGEPAAFETGFAVKWLIERQLAGAAGLRFSGINPVAPLIIWGPYLWENSWPKSYLQDDCIHPSPIAQGIISEKFLNFLKTDFTARTWYLSGSAQTTPIPTLPPPTPTFIPSLTPTAVLTPSPTPTFAISPTPTMTPIPTFGPSATPPSATITPRPTTNPSSNLRSVDLNKDRRIDILDYDIFLPSFGISSARPQNTDFNRDGSVDIFDYNILVEQFGRVR